MHSADPGELWTGPQLAAQLAALNGAAPAPACHVVLRLSRLADGSQTALYEVPEEAVALDPATWPAWLARRGLLGSGQLRVPLLLIRETLDTAGCLAECTLERRLGALDGPFHGEPPRVDFVGPARLVRAYRAQRNGQLAQIALAPQILPPGPRGSEPFAGELLALKRRFGPALQVIDAREPTLFEDVAGLSSIVHLRLPDGKALACGIGWHGTTPFILVADFPRFDVPLALPPPDEVAVLDALSRLDLVRHETRLDGQGLAVLARRRGGPELFELRSAGGRVAVQPYQPGSAQAGSADQRGWLRYMEMHEGLAPLDLHPDGTSGDLIVLTGDPGGHVWRHLVDPDGVEAWRRPADDAAVAAVHREHLAPGSLARAEGAPSTAAVAPEQEPPSAPPESLLAKARAFQAAMSALQAACGIALATGGDPAAAGLADHLRSLVDALELLSAEHSADQATALLAEVRAGANPERLVRDLSRLESRLQEELAQIRLVALRPDQARHLREAAPFGAAVEARFPGCAYDIEEAANCLAFGRASAAVFHCMKVVERGLRAFGRRQGLPGFPGKTRGWSTILSTARSACPEELAPALTQLQRIRQRWHAPGLDPADKYTEAEAAMVFRSVGAFMRALAEQCEEAGG